MFLIGFISGIIVGFAISRFFIKSFNKWFNNDRS